MEILSKTEYYVMHPFIGYLSLLLVVVFAVISIGLLIEGIKDSELPPILFALFFIGLAVISYKGFDFSLERKMIYEYKVTITDFNEVYEKGYKITDRNGKIYTVTKHGEDN